MIFSTKQWDRFARGYFIYDCAISTKDFVVFVLIEEKSVDDDIYPKTRFLICYLDEPVDERFYYHEYGHFNYTNIALSTAPQREVVAVDVSGHVYSYNPDSDEEEIALKSPWLNNNAMNDNMRSSIASLKRVSGSLYALASERQLFRHEGKNKWTPLANTPHGIPFPMDLKAGDRKMIHMGVEDMDAFGPNDMYAVGGVGDVWHYSGKAWRQIHFPSNELLYTVCCAGDGNVYITGNMGSLWVGREDRWKRLQDGELSLSFKDSAWFAGKLFCGNDYGLWVKSPEGELLPLRESEGVNSLVATSCGRIDISPDGSLMLTAGPHGAALYDGKKWEVLFNAAQF